MDLVNLRPVARRQKLERWLLRGLTIIHGGQYFNFVKLRVARIEAQRLLGEPKAFLRLTSVDGGIGGALRKRGM